MSDGQPASTSSGQASRLGPGTRVEVQTRFDHSWTQGFEVSEVLDNGYRIRRLTDDAVLPVVFNPNEVRRERRRQTWWV